MSAITEELRRLFDSDLPDPHLVLEGGRLRVAPAPAAGEGLDVASRAELLEQYGGRPPSEEALGELASRLESTLSTLGG
jgi:hypothetical protein